MNFQDRNKEFKVVISVGDESGIGPEIILKALCSNQIPDNLDFTLVGSKKNLLKTYNHLKALGLEKIAIKIVKKINLKTFYEFSKYK